MGSSLSKVLTTYKLTEKEERMVSLQDVSLISGYGGKYET